MKNNKQRIKMIIFTIIFLGVVGFTAYNIVYYVMLNIQLNRVSIIVKKIDKMVEIKYIDGDLINNYNGKYKNEKLLFADLTKSKNYNEDISGYIKVSGINISTVYAYTNEREYYLNRTLDHDENMFGWIYLDNRNYVDYSSNNNIFYAHGIPDKTLFAELKKMLNKDWFNNNKHLIYTSNESNSYLWETFSVYYTNGSSTYLDIDLKQDYLNKSIGESAHNFDTVVSENDKIITLVTCYDLSGYHLIVHAKLIKQGKI